MLCDICGKKTAKIIITEIRNGEKREKHLCEECATDNKSLKINMPNLPGDISLNIGNLLSFAMIGAKNLQKKPGIEAIEEHACPNCGVTFSEFKKSGMFGCEKCYEAFGVMLPITLTSIQPGTVHTGKKPVRMAGEKNLEYVPGEERAAKAPASGAADTVKAPEGVSTSAEAKKNAVDNARSAANEKAAARKIAKAAAVKSLAEKIDRIKKENDELRDKLKAALEIEDYEEAARLRDIIRAKNAPQKEENIPAPRKRSTKKKPSGEEAEK